MNNKRSSERKFIGLLDVYHRQVQGIGRDEEEALTEAKKYNIGGLDDNATVETLNDRYEGDERFFFVELTRREKEKLDEDPEWGFGRFCSRIFG